MSKSAHLFFHPCTAPLTNPLSLRSQCAHWPWQSASPVPSSPLPKGGIPHRTSCYVPVGDDAHIVPLPRTSCCASVGVGLPDDPPGLEPHPLYPSVGADDPVAVPKIFALPYG